MNTTITNKILVPVDFTKETENSLSFAIALAEKEGALIVVLHIISGEEARKDAEAKLEDLLSKIEYKKIEAHVAIGSVLKDIGVIAEGMGATLMVMGTHGNVGLMSKILGSKTIRILATSKVPMIITQKETHFHAIKTIVMTVDLEKESIQVAKHAVRIAELYQSKVILVGSEQDDDFLKRKIDTNLRVCRNYLEESGLDTEIHMISAKGYVKGLVAFCKEVNADLLAATYYEESFFSFSEHLVKVLATNPLQIPLMTLDGESTAIASQFGFITQ